METHASHLRPSFSWRSPLLRRMTRCLHKGCVPQHRVRHIHAIRGLHGFTIATERIELPAGPWPLAHLAETSVPCIRALDPDSSGASMLLNQGQWTHAADTRDLAADAPGLIPFVVHEAKCTQATQRDSGARQRAKEAHLAAPWALIRLLS